MRIESGSLISDLSHDLVRNVITIQGSEEAKRPETPGTRVDTESAFSIMSAVFVNFLGFIYFMI